MIDLGDKQSIGVLGGTFDPVHLAHLGVATKVLQILNLDCVLFIPCSIPSHKIEPKASAEQRLDMLKLALSDTEKFMVDDRDIERGGITYTVDTLKSLRNDIGAGQEVYFIMGMDSFNNLHSWHNYTDILSYANIVVYPRSGVECTQETPEIIQHIHEYNGKPASFGHIYICDGEQWQLSSSGIRAEIQGSGTNISDLPSGVVSYIDTHQLYQ